MAKNLKLFLNNAILNGNYKAFPQHCTDDTKWIFAGDQILPVKEKVG